jgi:hypothetical protein
MLIRRSGIADIEVTGLYDEETREALFDLFGRENLEERWLEDYVDRVALEYLQGLFP